METKKEFVNKEREFEYALHDRSFHGGYSIAERLRKKVNRICEIQGFDLPTQQILFLYDWTQYSGGPMSCVIQLSPLTRELLYQTTGCLFTVAIRLKKEGTTHILEAPLSNEIYHCLRHLRVNKKTGYLEVVHHHAIEQWPEQAVFADGVGYAVDSPNLFDVRILPESEQPSTATAVKAGQNTQTTRLTQ